MKHLCCTDNLLSLPILILHDLLSLCSFFLSHPLIFAYLLLLYPYLLKLILFLYPLLFSTFLLLLALLTVTFHLNDNSSNTSSAVLNFLRSELAADEAKVSLAEQLCAMVFVDSRFCSCQMEPNDGCDSGNQINRFDGAEDLSEKTILRSRRDHSRRPSEILQRDGSMRKEKEWKRTLACKLFEERMTFKLCEERKVVDGAEEMDLLWEAYEDDADKIEKQRRKEKDANRAVKEKVEEEEGEEEQEEGISGQLCCLQALKLSAGKMNLGVGRPSLVKLSMALKGMAVFHRRGRRRKIN